MNQNAPSGWMGSPILGRYDKDPGRYRPQWYHLEMDVAVAAGGQGTGTIVLANQPYCIVRMNAKIVGDTSNDQSGIVEDGQYDIEWKDSQHNYVDGPIAANLMWGWNERGYVIDFPFPLPYAGNETLSFRVTNRVTRVLVPTADYFRVQICVHGITDLGELQR